jgi:nucleoside 2-deoxyribosyltransferase
MSLYVYLAAPYACRDNLRPLADELRSIGMYVTSSWLEEDAALGSGQVGAATDLDDSAARAHVKKDFADIDRADVLVAFTAEASKVLNVSTISHSGGRHIETGYAIAKGKEVVVIGKPENIFHRALTMVPDWHAAVLRLVWLERTMPRAEATR